MNQILNNSHFSLCKYKYFLNKYEDIICIPYNLYLNIAYYLHLMLLTFNCHYMYIYKFINY